MAEKLTFSGTEVESHDPCGDDAIFDIGVTSNRPDSLCHLGLAREVAAVEGMGVDFPECAAAHDGPATADATSVTVEDAEACPRFTARVIEGIKVGPSPAWLSARLESLGMRAVNNVVDVTNYVLHELNQPLHAYDLDKLEEQRIVVRRARSGEELVAINGNTYKLDAEDLVIADAQRPVGLAGVMGGLDTEVGAGTTRILMESAAFHAPTVRRMARRTQLSSDASYRFERGCDRQGALQASERACRMILELCGGTLRSDPIDVGGDGPSPESVLLRMSEVERICGISVPLDRCAAILEALECAVESNGDDLRVTPPSFRADLTREIDLVEEVIRLHGLEHLPVAPGMPIMPVHDHPARMLRERAKDRMVGLGYLETVTPDFVIEGLPSQTTFLLSGEGLLVKNPVRKGEGALRRSLLPSLLTVRKHNQDRGNDGVRVFEISNVRAAPESADQPVPHLPVLGWLTDDDYRAARGAVEALLEHLGVSMTVTPAESPWLEPGASGDIMAGGERIGVLGHPSRRLLKDLGLKGNPVYGECDLEAVGRLAVDMRKFSGLARYPGVTRDLTIDVDDIRPYGDVSAIVEEAALQWLETVELVDVYRGKNVGPGKKSPTIRFFFRSPEGTLTSADVDGEMARLMEMLKSKIGAVIRA